MAAPPMRTTPAQAGVITRRPPANNHPEAVLRCFYQGVTHDNDPRSVAKYATKTACLAAQRPVAILRRGSHTHAELLHVDALRRWLAAKSPQPAVLQQHVVPLHDVRWVVTYAARGDVAEVVVVPRRFGDAYARGVMVNDDQQHVDQPCSSSHESVGGEPPQVDSFFNALLLPNLIHYHPQTALRRCLLDIVQCVFRAHHKQIISISCDFVQNAQVLEQARPPSHVHTQSRHRVSLCCWTSITLQRSTLQNRLHRLQHHSNRGTVKAHGPMTAHQCLVHSDCRLPTYSAISTAITLAASQEKPPGPTHVPPPGWAPPGPPPGAPPRRAAWPTPHARPSPSSPGHPPPQPPAPCSSRRPYGRR